MRRAGRALLTLGLAVTATGCGAVFGGLGVAPNGLPHPDDRIRRLLAGGDAPAAFARLEGGEDAPDDELLRMLYTGTAGRYAGAYAESSLYFDIASALSEDRVTRSLSREALAFLTNDRVLPYTPARTERLFIHYFAALNYLEAGAADEAAVEARRISRLLDRYDDGLAPDRYPATSRFLRYLAGAVFEAAGQAQDAEVAYRHTPRLTARLDPAGPAAGSATLAPAATSAVRPERTGDVVVLVERGFVPHLVQQELVLTLPGHAARRLAGHGGGHATLADEIAAQVARALDGRPRRPDRRLRPIAVDLTDRFGHDRDDDDDDALPYVLRVAWPAFRDDRPARGGARLLVDGVDAGRFVGTDIAAAVVRDFEGERLTRLARTVARAAVKLAATKALESEVSEKDDTAGEIVGLLANAATAVMERADTRCWHFLPARVDALRLRLPPGAHRLTLRPDRSGSPAVDLGTVEVRAGRVAVVARRLWR